MVLLGQLLDGHGDLCTLADDDTARAHFDGTQLGLVAVTQDNQVALLYVVLHQIRVRRRDEYLALVVIILGGAHQNGALQGVDDIAVLGVGLSQDLAVQHIHVGCGDIADGNQTFNLLFLGNRQRHGSDAAHQVPCLLQGQIALYAFRLSDLDILYLCHHVSHIDRCFRLEEVQHVLRLLVQLSGTRRNVSAALQRILQIRISQRRTDRIRIRIFVTDNIHRSCHIFFHFKPLLYTYFQLPLFYHCHHPVYKWYSCIFYCALRPQ